MGNGSNGFLAEKMFQKLLLLMYHYRNQKNLGAEVSKSKVDLKKVKSMASGLNGMIMSILNHMANMT